MSELLTVGNRYRLEDRIGSGGMAEVYRGFDEVLNRPVAVKILNPVFARDAAFVERFKREARAAASLNHPNIVGAYDSGSDDGTHYFVMELVEGKTLAEAFGLGRRPNPVQAAEIAEAICAALAAAHARGVVHRDIKPANIMITRQGTVKVMDFGIARMTATGETAPHTSAVLGTAAYLSPEQAQGEVVDSRSDIYSLGAVLYEMLAGRPPFSGDSAVAIAYKQVNEMPAVPSSINPAVPAAMDAIAMRALSKNPANRYQTAEEFAADLKASRSGGSVTATPLMVSSAEATQLIARPASTQVLDPVEPPPGDNRKMWLGVMIGAVLLAVLGAGIFFLINGLNGVDTQADIKVPNVVGKTFDEAKVELEDREFVVAAKDQISDQPPGTVLNQDPPADTLLKAGSTVTLTVAVEATTTLVPDLTNMVRDEYLTALDNAELAIGEETTEYSDTVEKDHVIRQDPAFGDEVDKNTPINVVISLGPDHIDVPDLTGLSQADARAKLLEVGLKMGDAPRIDSQTVPRGDVISQDPASGTSVDPGSTVDVVLSGGFLLPDVTCLSFSDAKTQLTLTYGLLVVNGGTVPGNAACPGPNLVAATSPGPSGRIGRGETVVLYTNEVISP